jgi:hypothetical protein
MSDLRDALDDYRQAGTPTEAQQKAVQEAASKLSILLKMCVSLFFGTVCSDLTHSGTIQNIPTL